MRLSANSNDEIVVTRDIRVLHVDDDAAFLDLATDALEREGGFAVTTTTDPTAVRERFDLPEFDAVVSDYEMPERNGLALLESVREAHPDLPCFVFTGKGSEAVASDAISIGVTDYLQKKPGLDQFTLLANRIRNAVERTETVAELRRETHRRDRILEATPMGIVVHDRHGAVELRNERARELLGTTTDAMDVSAYSDAPWELERPDGTPVDRDSLPFSRVLAAEAPIHDEAYVVHREDGTRQPIVVHGAPLRTETGALDGAVIVFGVP
ncbi:response regulator [Haloarcula marina]|uniref:response regulator n=1 Tax=Haloarcula marina TaxID=2961574 RepID=UPI0020B6F564|nr:response regulator [Halomicroarcula marina]